MEANLTELITSLKSCIYKQDYFLYKNTLELGTELDVCLQE